MMELESLRVGDRIRTTEGDLGTVVLIAKLTVFVRLDGEKEDASLKAMLASQLTRVEPSSEEGPVPHRDPNHSG